MTTGDPVSPPFAKPPISQSSISPNHTRRIHVSLLCDRTATPDSPVPRAYIGALADARRTVLSRAEPGGAGTSRR